MFNPKFYDDVNARLLYLAIWIRTDKQTTLPRQEQKENLTLIVRSQNTKFLVDEIVMVKYRCADDVSFNTVT